MSTTSSGPRPLSPAQAYFRPRPGPEWRPVNDVQAGRSVGDATRDPFAAARASGPLWTAASSQHAESASMGRETGMETDSNSPSTYMHARSEYDTCVSGRERRPERRTHVSALHAVGRAPQVHHASRAPLSAWLPRVSAAGPPPPNVARVPVPLRLDDGDAALRRFAPGRSWEEVTVATAYASPISSSFTPAGMWGSGSESRRVQPAFPVMDAPFAAAEPTQPPQLQLQSVPAVAEDDDDEHHGAHTFVCEWTDERGGTCNMDVSGDRVWMSHHLSQEHNVIGHERMQRACLWRGCTDTMNKGSLARHIVSRHLRAGASCGFCRKVYSRTDVARRHTKKCKVANGALVRCDQTK